MKHNVIGKSHGGQFTKLVFHFGFELTSSISHAYGVDRNACQYFHASLKTVKIST